MKLSFRAAAVAVVSLSGLPATTGCGDDGGDATDTRVPDATDGNDATDGADGTATDTPDGETSAATGDIEGRWAMLEVQSALVTTALLGTQTQTSTSYYLADLADGTMTVTLCDWRTEDTSGLTRTRMGDSVLANLDPFVRDYSVTADGDGFLFAAADGFALRGVELANPATDPMPTDAGDSHVVDQDGDGKPGITLVVQGTVTGSLYVGHRHHAALAGALASDTHITGLTDWETEQVIFGSDPALLAEQKPVAITDPDASRSHFEMVKVGDGDDCAAINAARATLFP